MEGRDASGRLHLRALAERPVTALSGVGPRKAEALEEMGITTVLDLVTHRPGRIVPVYPQSDKAGLTTWELADWIEVALRRAGELADPLPEAWRSRLEMVDRTTAMGQVHTPDSIATAQSGRRRLAF